MKKNENETIIKCVIKLNKVFFPKGKSHIPSGEYGIFSAEITEEKENCGGLNGTIKLKGNCCEINYGDSYNVSCKLSDVNEKYGNTYSIVYINRLIDLQDKVKQHNFLTSILNETTVNALFEKYDDVISLLENENLKELTSIKGIGKVTALKMIDKYNDCKDYGAIYTELGMLGLTTNMIKKLVAFYKSPDIVIDTVKSNPYNLVKVDGIGFKKADEIADKLNISGSNPNRVKGAILYVLSEAGANGKSYIHYSELMTTLNDLIGYVEQDIINSVAKNLIDSKEVFLSNNGEMIGIYKYRKLEEDIATELLRLLNADSQVKINNIDKIIEATEIQQGFEFNEEQRDFIIKFTKNNVIALTGGSGTGKSTSMRGAVNASRNYSCVGCSLSGKASLRLQECTDVESMTIHRLLGYENGKFLANEENQLGFDVYLMDEATMTSGELFLSFLKAIPSGSKVVFAGDIQQLTPVGSCQVFADILNSNIIPCVKLIKINRQASKSEIINIGYKIINQQPICDNTFQGERTIGELQDFTMVGFKENLEPELLVVKYFLKRLETEKDIMETQIVVPMKNRGNMCTYNLNLKIQEKVNPINANKKNVIISLSKDKQYILQIGDKVINCKNNYNVPYANEDIEEKTSVFNGSMGIIKDIKDGYVTIDFIGIGEVIFDGGDCKSLELGYACTTHKCLPEDTWVYSENGLIQLKSLNNGANVGEFKELIVSPKIFNGNYLEKPSHFYNNGLDNCKEIISKRGYKVTATLNHGVDVIDYTGYIKRKDVKDITLNDHIIISKNMNVYGNVVDLNFKIPILNNKSKSYSIPKSLTCDFSEFLGLMYGDGVITNCGISLGKEHKEVVDRFCELVYKIFGYNGKVKYLEYTNMYKCEISSLFIRDICNQIEELKPNNKTIPKIILATNKENQCAFLKGLFEDGYVRIKNKKFDYIELAQKEYSNIEIIRLMLLNLGIICTVKTHEYKKGYVYTRLYIYKKQAKLFKKHIGFITTEKINRLNLCELEETHTCSNIYYPNITKIIESMINKYNIVFLDNKFKSNLNYSIKSNKITDNLLNKFLYRILYLSETSEYKYLKYLYDYCYVDSIESVKSSKEITYCLTMPETHKFVQNGILGWNCQGSQFRSVIYAINSSDYVLLNVENGYTGITRASKHCTFIFKVQALNTMLNKREMKNKQTYLSRILMKNTIDK